MKIAKISAVAAAASLAIAPVAIQAAPGSARTAAPVEGESELAGGIGAAAVILAIGAIGIGALLIAEDDDEDAVSP
ncbi:hypothetical protein [Alteriqipengyuania lutimaris]|uniref:Uncharacterized protein n=1 Tax=Alteriqipengyuania lutimaris TaxID=1538146 RepID=A0A395LIA1_9SPHN|nr:hypothetical protein [Alteriqipengyuania lutimaris]MBB3034767.1 hypothetical protein [Alteriqipengyuania lutimaris]RDS76385.1 hypothetical protein DL238_01335 [Alteriqipengyuania lutimaris]